MQNYLFDHHACTDNAESYLHISDIKEMPEILRKPQSCACVPVSMKCEPWPWLGSRCVSPRYSHSQAVLS